MSTSSLPAVIDALVAEFHAIYDGPGVPVLDGPEASDTNPGQFVAVGYDGDAEALDDAAAIFAQSWADVGARTRDEELDIVCCCCVLSAPTVKAARDAVYALFSLAEAGLRATPTLGAETAGVLWLEIVGGQYHPVATPTGIGARIVFTVHARCQI